MRGISISFVSDFTRFQGRYDFKNVRPSMSVIGNPYLDGTALTLSPGIMLISLPVPGNTGAAIGFGSAFIAAEDVVEEEFKMESKSKSLDNPFVNGSGLLSSIREIRRLVLTTLSTLQFKNVHDRT